MMRKPCQAGRDVLPYARCMKKRMVWILAAAMLVTGCYPPPASYPYTNLIVQRRNLLCENLVKLLPEQQRSIPAAREEARWLADTAYKAAAGISRINGSCFPGWAGNALINAHLQDRGLCWQYQHDMYRELRRRPLKYFAIGCCVRDRAERSEHNCVYVRAINDVWPNAWVLDAWMWNGRLKVNLATELNPERWVERPVVCKTLQMIYPEGHQMPIEHWGILRNGFNSYTYYWEKGMENAGQYKRMLENIEDGKKEHPGSLTNY